MIKLQAFPAEDGDSFLLSLGQDECFNILIDLGREITFENYIKPALRKLDSEGKKIDLLVITHVDADHIDGALPFIIENGENCKIIKIDEVWHNIFKHLQFNKQKIEKISDQEKSILNSLILQNQIMKKDGLSDISVMQGISFGGYLIKYNYNWNTSFQGKAVSTNSLANAQDKLFKIILLTPSEEQLGNLSKIWLKKLESLKYNFNISGEEIFDDAYEFYMRNLAPVEIEYSEISDSTPSKSIEDLAIIEEQDNSKTNASSISFILEYNLNKILFLADAHEPDVYDSLEKLKNEGFQLDFELVKLSHHGSNKNISNRMLELIDSKRYLVSTNGKKHGHPNYETISKILIKKSKYKKFLIFNYDLPQVKFFNDEKLKLKYNYEIEVVNELVF